MLNVCLTLVGRLIHLNGVLSSAGYKRINIVECDVIDSHFSRVS